MATSDVCKETNKKCEGTSEHGDDLEWHHDDLHEKGHTWACEGVNPIVFVGAEVGDQEGEDCQDACEGNVARKVGGTREERQQTNEVVEPNEEEESEQERKELFALLFANLLIANLLNEGYEIFCSICCAMRYVVRFLDAACSSHKERKT